MKSTCRNCEYIYMGTNKPCECQLGFKVKTVTKSDNEATAKFGHKVFVTDVVPCESCESAYSKYSKKNKKRSNA